MLKIKNLKAGIEEVQILKGINLEVKAGEVHAIMAVSYTHLTLPTNREV